MCSIATKFVFGFAAVIAFSGCANAAVGNPPRILQEPVLGLRYEVAKVRFEPLPQTVLAGCSTLVDNDNYHNKWFLYGKATDNSGHTFYVAGGYTINQNPEPPKYPRYELSDEGVVFRVDGDHCLTIGGVRETFEAEYEEETPKAVLQQLAADIVAKFNRAFGGPESLRREIRAQRIDQEQVSPLLRAAFKEYFVPTSPR